MAEDLKLIDSQDKEEKYRSLLPQIQALVAEEEDAIANMANICSALKYGMDFFWVGFYLVKNDELVLGPFQGPPACTRIRKGKGVCGSAWDKKQVIIVEDVDQFPGHIACSSGSRSEIVLPKIKKGEVELILDVDSDTLAEFDQIDEKYLTEVLDLI